jgi:hypothetical protein
VRASLDFDYGALDVASFMFCLLANAFTEQTHKYTTCKQTAQKEPARTKAIDLLHLGAHVTEVLAAVACALAHDWI